MKNFIIIFNLFFIACTIISCGNDTTNNDSQESEELVKQSKSNNHIVEILKQPSMFSSLIEEFESISMMPNEEYISVQSFKLPSDNIICILQSNKELCQQILKYFQDNELSFMSDKESIIVEEFSERYSSTQQGVINIGENNYEADLYFNCIHDGDRMMFSGKLVFHLPEISLLEDRPIVIDVKAKK